MFTGIIEQTGQLIRTTNKGGDVSMLIKASATFLKGVVLGDSIAVNGVCLTAVTLDNDIFSADVSNETLSTTSLSQLKTGSTVNLEKALTLSTPLGGHLVSGHVDGLAELIELNKDARSIRLTFKSPAALGKYIAAKGSVTLDGISLTVNSVNDNLFDVNIVPHTQEKTTLQDIQIGRMVNLEVDLIARYLERLLTAKETKPAPQGLNLQTLASSGFLK